ncbi:hypothetical protein CJ305_11855 [Leeuwenhoekiella nanhaiensis]|uniref:Uncharacterized protein n=1 Tax=Leeuwenhoekiella nanhaiensis TaxID=1655491 RepID=A0A2G1VQ53_9FLAO|nr:hypothetical protein CJ305_11855 [Leeuwenhoekiella nanhaiensis]
MTKKFSLNLFLVILLYSCILVSGLLNILARAEVLAGLGLIFGLLLFNLIKNQRKDTTSGS